MMGSSAFASSPLTNFGQTIAFGSRGLRILSHKGRGKPRRAVLPQARPERGALYLSPCGRGYEGRTKRQLSAWPKLVRGNTPGAAA
jgi:hypothetical protein